jgi:hypothetical protein
MKVHEPTRDEDWILWDDRSRPKPTQRQRALVRMLLAHVDDDGEKASMLARVVQQPYLITVGAQGNVVTANRAARRLLAWTTDSLEMPLSSSSTFTWPRQLARQVLDAQWMRLDRAPLLTTEGHPLVVSIDAIALQHAVAEGQFIALGVGAPRE